MVGTGSVVWIDEVDPAVAVAAAGSKMGRLVELHRAGVQVPAGFAVTIDIAEGADGLPALGDLVRAIVAAAGDERFEADAGICGVQRRFERDDGGLVFGGGRTLRSGARRFGGGDRGGLFFGVAAAARSSQDRKQEQQQQRYSARCR